MAKVPFLTPPIPAFVCAVAIVLFGLVACNKSSGSTSSEESLDLQISIKTSLSAGIGDEISLNYYNNKGPLTTDLVVFKTTSGSDEYTCTIVSSSDGTFSFRIDSEIPTASYRFCIRRGSTDKTLGTVSFTFIDRVTIEEKADMNVYGRVYCGDDGVEGVVVSDGVEATVTDEDGVYYLASEKKYGYVWISVPGDYEAASDGILPVFWAALSSSASTTERNDFELTKTSSDNFTLYILGDMHLANRTNDLNQFNNFVEDLNSTISVTSGRQYGLTLGDMTWDLYWYSNNFSFSEYLSLMNSGFSGIQFYHTMGNHDNDYEKVGDFNKEQAYRNALCPTFYSCNIGKFHLIVMDDIDFNSVAAGTDYRDQYGTNFTAEQMAWLEKDLSYVDTSTPVIFSTHAPAYMPSGASSFKQNLTDGSTTGEGNISDIRTALADYTVHFFSGHTHDSFNYDDLSGGNFFEHNAGSVCGTWWWSGYFVSGINIARDGTPGGYTILKANDTELSWQYKSTGYDISNQFRSYDMNEVQKVVTSDLVTNSSYVSYFTKYVTAMNSYPANTVLLNVWNYDPSWTISVKENGTVLTVTNLYEYDPLHIIAHSANKLSTASTNFLTRQWCHIFSVQASSATSTLQIDVTDRFGNVYSETMTRPKTFSTANYK